MTPAIRKILTWAAAFDCQRVEHAEVAIIAEPCTRAQPCVSCSAENELLEAGFLGGGELGSDIRSCIVCGCTEDNACGTGCYWMPGTAAGAPLCSACGDPAAPSPRSAPSSAAIAGTGPTAAPALAPYRANCPRCAQPQLEFCEDHRKVECGNCGAVFEARLVAVDRHG